MIYLKSVVLLVPLLCVHILSSGIIHLRAKLPTVTLASLHCTPPAIPPSSLPRCCSYAHGDASAVGSRAAVGYVPWTLKARLSRASQG